MSEQERLEQIKAQVNEAKEQKDKSQLILELETALAASQEREVKLREALYDLIYRDPHDLNDKRPCKTCQNAKDALQEPNVR